MGSTGRNGEEGISRQGWAYGVLKWIKGAKVRTRNRNVIERNKGLGNENGTRGK